MVDVPCHVLKHVCISFAVCCGRCALLLYLDYRAVCVCVYMCRMFFCFALEIRMHPARCAHGGPVLECGAFEPEPHSHTHTRSPRASCMSILVPLSPPLPSSPPSSPLCVYRPPRSCLSSCESTMRSSWRSRIARNGPCGPRPSPRTRRRAQRRWGKGLPWQCVCVCVHACVCMRVCACVCGVCAHSFFEADGHGALSCCRCHMVRCACCCCTCCCFDGGCGCRW